MVTGNINFGVVATVFSTDAREAASASRAAGLEGLEFDAVTRALDLTQLSQTGKREFTHLLRSNEQELIALRADLGAKGFGPGADIDRLLSRLSNIMEAAKGLTPTPMVCVDLGPLPEPEAQATAPPRVTPEQAGLIIIPDLSPSAPPPTPTRPPADPAFVASVDGALREVCSFADRVGVTVAVRTDLASFAAIERALAAAACPWLGVDLDPVGMLRDDWPADEAFSRLGPQIRHVRGRDATAGADKRTQPAIIGRGSTDWPKLLGDLDGAGYRGWITIDPLELPDRAGAAIAGLRHLRS